MIRNWQLPSSFFLCKHDLKRSLISLSFLTYLAFSGKKIMMENQDVTFDEKNLLF